MTIIGAGAVGSYYGALLARDGNDVTMIARGAQLEALTRSARVVVQEADGERWSAPIRAASHPPTTTRIVIVTTKSHHTIAAAPLAAAALASDGALLSLQNGVENVDLLERTVGEGTALAGIAFVGVWMAAPGVVVHEAEGWVRVGDPAGGLTPRSRALHAALDPSWDVAHSPDITLDQWRKLLWNIGFNALCAVTGATAGEALAVPETRELVRAAMHEAVAIADANGVDLTSDDVGEMAAHNDELRHYRPSTARDLDAGKEVERDALCGYLVREGSRVRVETPVNRVLDALLAMQISRRGAP